jgi:sugar phosphate isomerase/epimerase
VIREAPQKVRQFHVKDRAGEGDPDSPAGHMCDLGTGVIDFPRIFRSHEVEEYVVENDTPDVTPLTSTWTTWSTDPPRWSRKALVPISEPSLGTPRRA